VEAYFINFASLFVQNFLSIPLPAIMQAEKGRRVVRRIMNGDDPDTCLAGTQCADLTRLLHVPGRYAWGKPPEIMVWDTQSYEVPARAGLPGISFQDISYCVEYF
jgi:hypothetical protein